MTNSRSERSESKAGSEKENELMRQERINKAIERLKGMSFEAGLYYTHETDENDRRYLERIWKGADNIIAILEGEPLPYPPKEIPA